MQFVFLKRAVCLYSQTQSLFWLFDIRDERYVISGDIFYTGLFFPDYADRLGSDLVCA